MAARSKTTKKTTCSWAFRLVMATSHLVVLLPTPVHADLQQQVSCGMCEVLNLAEFGLLDCFEFCGDNNNNIVDEADVTYLASDALTGRVPNTAGSVEAQTYLINELQSMGATGADSGGTYKQAFDSDTGTNIVGILEGAVLPNEYLILGAHYDHISDCRVVDTASSSVCNGATDNAAGVAAVLGIGRKLAQLATPPRRSIVLAFWDKEELGLVGSKYYIDNPLVPLDDTLAYLNFDVMGWNVLPSLRSTTFAVGAETGGDELKRALDRAVSGEGLDVKILSLALGLGRGDHQSFANARVPTVFFSDSSLGGCYHTDGDEVKVVDFGKLQKQARIGFKLALDLANTNDPPTGFQMSPDFNPEDTLGIESVLGVMETDFELVFPVEINDFGTILQSLETGNFYQLVSTIEEDLEKLECDGSLA